MKKYLLLLILFYCVQAKAQFTSLVWSDEFNDPTINTTNWKYDTGGGGWGNNELEYYTTRPVNANIENGNLQIIAKKEAYQGKSYTSARLKTQGLRNFTYGKVEARIKAPVGQGIWPAFWMLGKNISDTGWGWPKCGEIDILEHINKATVLNGTLHWDYNNAHKQYGTTTPCDVTKFHLYGMEWDANAIKLFLDGKEYFKMSIANNVSSTDEFHLPFFFILNLAVGGNWPGSPDATTIFPDTMFVDYVRVYGLTTGVGSIEGNPNTEHLMSQNYPNPFNSSTTISFNLPSKSPVSLAVLNANGQEVATIESKELPAGDYTREWNASGFPAGIYYYRLQAGQFTETKKLILIK